MVWKLDNCRDLSFIRFYGPKKPQMILECGAPQLKSLSMAHNYLKSGPQCLWSSVLPLIFTVHSKKIAPRLIHNVLFPKLCFSGLGLLCCWHSASGFLWPLISAFNHFLLQPATACRPTRQWRMISYHGGVESLYTRLVPGSIPVKGFSWVYTGLIFPRPQLRANVLKTTLNLLSTVSLKYSTASARLIITSDKWSSAEYKPGELGL